MSGGLVVLISGRGSNLRAILEHPVGAQVRAVISDKVEAAGLEIARAAGKPVHICTQSDGETTTMEEMLSAQIACYAPRLIALAGFMRVLSAAFISVHKGNIVNIHPSLLPAFRGLNTHRRVLAAGERRHGCTAHWVSAEIDGGEIIAQEELTVLPEDDEHSLAARVLELEHRMYPRVLAHLLKTE